MAASLASRTRDPYTFINQDALPAIPRDTLTKLLQYWDKTADPTTYLDYFTKDAVLKFAGNHEGHKGIKACRDSMIHPEKGPVTKCQHFFENAFVLGGGEEGGDKDGAWEIIGVADVRYTLVGSGTEVWTRAASWCKVVQEDGKWKSNEYEVFMDASGLVAAITANAQPPTNGTA